MQNPSARETNSNVGLNRQGRKNVRFQWKTGHISETVRDPVRPSLLLITNRKWNTLF